MIVWDWKTCLCEYPSSMKSICIHVWEVDHVTENQYLVHVGSDSTNRTNRLLNSESQTWHRSSYAKLCIRVASRKLGLGQFLTLNGASIINSLLLDNVCIAKYKPIINPNHTWLTTRAASVLWYCLMSHKPDLPYSNSWLTRLNWYKCSSRMSPWFSEQFRII